MITPRATAAGMAMNSASSGSGGAPAGSVSKAQRNSQMSPAIKRAMNTVTITGAA